MLYDRLTAAWKALFEETFPLEQFKGNFQYVVRKCDFAGQTADLEPVNVEIGLPALTKVPIRSPLMMVKLVPGEVVLVGFENYSPAYPYVAALPTAGASALPVVRTGDMAVVYAQVVPLASMFAPLPGGVPPLPNVMGVVIDPTQLGPPAVPPVPPAVGTAKLFGIASTGSQSVKVR